MYHAVIGAKLDLRILIWWLLVPSATFGGQSGIDWRRATSPVAIVACGRQIDCTMTTVEALHTRLDKLQWDANQLETENRRLRKENPKASRVLTLEAALKRSEDETASLRNQITKETQYQSWRRWSWT